MVWRLLLEHNLAIFCEYVCAMTFSLIFLPVFSSEKLKTEIRGSYRILHSIVCYECTIIYLNFYIMLLPYVYNHKCDAYPYTLSLRTGFVSIIYLPSSLSHVHTHAQCTHIPRLSSIIYPSFLLYGVTKSKDMFIFNLRKCYIALHWLNIFLIRINKNLLCLMLDTIMYCHNIFLHPQGFCFKWHFFNYECSWESFFVSLKVTYVFFFFWHCSSYQKVRRVFQSMIFFDSSLVLLFFFKTSFV